MLDHGGFVVGSGITVIIAVVFSSHELLLQGGILASILVALGVKHLERVERGGGETPGKGVILLFMIGGMSREPYKSSSWVSAI